MSLDPILDIASTIISRIWPNPADEAKATLAASEITAKLAEAQIGVNTAEAASENIFVAGWRPFIGWVCGISFAWQFLVEPIITFIAASCGHPLTNLPVLDTESLNTVLMGMLGIGMMRSYDKHSYLNHKKGK